MPQVTVKPFNEIRGGLDEFAFSQGRSKLLRRRAQGEVLGRAGRARIPALRREQFMTTKKVTKDELALAAMQALIQASPSFGGPIDSYADLATFSYAMADIMLAKRREIEAAKKKAPKIGEVDVPVPAEVPRDQDTHTGEGLKP
ncbi:MAG TPA: hypothetical protein VF316_05365 [Polyangiaceae bacterium]